MNERNALIEAIRNLQVTDFEALALQVFRYQAAHNPLYNEFLQLLHIQAADIQKVADIPSLPISFFKSHTVKTGAWTAEQCFESSGTTGQIPSKHFVRDANFYYQTARRGFEQFYGAIDDWVFLALLPNYLERGNSSLVAMVDDFIRHSRHEESSFYLYNHEELAKKLTFCVEQRKKTMLIGVSYALLDFAESHPMPLESSVIVETGGMKGRRAELTRAELHEQLSAAFQVQKIHSEYGMTELLSQGWSAGEGLFFPSKSMQVRAAEINDPFAEVALGKTGLLKLIDLANIDSCAFIATEDIGRVYADGSFEVLGRLDSSEMRGCNLMLGAV